MQVKVSREKDGLMLSQFLAQEAADVPLWAIREVIKKRDVRIDGVRIDADVHIQEGQEIRVFWPKSVISAQQKEKTLPFPEIVFEDERVLLINKPQLDLDVEARYKEIYEAIKSTGRTDITWNLCRWALT